VRARTRCGEPEPVEPGPRWLSGSTGSNGADPVPPSTMTADFGSAGLLQDLSVHELGR